MAVDEDLLLVDSDCFVLLGISGLLLDGIRCLGFDPNRARRLDALPYMLRRGRLARRYPEEHLLEVRSLCDDVEPLTESAADARIRQALAETDAIDVGEAELFALMTEKPGYYLSTGDKRSLIALATSPDLREVYRAVKGRVICVETLLERLVKSQGIAPVAKAVTPLRPFDRMISAIFSRDEATPEAACLEGLASYVRDLESKIGPGFLMR